MPWKTLLAWSWTFVIMGLCWLPGIYLGKIEHSHKPLFIPNLDKLVHMGIFAVFAYLWMRAGTPGRRAWRVLGAGVGFAALTELVQELPIVSRDATLFDGLADTIGVLLGLGGFEVVRRHAARRAVKTPSAGTP